CDRPSKPAVNGSRISVADQSLERISGSLETFACQLRRSIFFPQRQCRAKQSKAVLRQVRVDRGAEWRCAVRKQTSRAHQRPCRAAIQKTPPHGICCGSGKEGAQL